MTVALVVGCSLIVWGPLLALFTVFISSTPKLVILSIGSSFFYCAAVILTSILWYIVPPARTLFYWAIPVSVILQAVFRYCLYSLWTHGQTSLALSAGAAAPRPSRADQLGSAVAAGLGSGLGCTLVMYLGVLWNFSGPGTLYSGSCGSSGVPLVVVTACLVLAWALLHVLLGVLAWSAFRRGSGRTHVLVVLLHGVASGTSSLNSVPGAAGQPICLVPLGVTWALVLVMTVYTVFKIRNDQVFVKRIK